MRRGLQYTMTRAMSAPQTSMVTPPSLRHATENATPFGQAFGNPPPTTGWSQPPLPTGFGIPTLSPIVNGVLLEWNYQSGVGTIKTDEGDNVQLFKAQATANNLAPRKGDRFAYRIDQTSAGTSYAYDLRVLGRGATQIGRLVAWDPRRQMGYLQQGEEKVVVFVGDVVGSWVNQWTVGDEMSFEVVKDGENRLWGRHVRRRRPASILDCTGLPIEGHVQMSKPQKGVFQFVALDKGYGLVNLENGESALIQARVWREASWAPIQGDSVVVQLVPSQRGGMVVGKLEIPGTKTVDGVVTDVLPRSIQLKVDGKDMNVPRSGVLREIQTPWREDAVKVQMLGGRLRTIQRVTPVSRLQGVVESFNLVNGSAIIKDPSTAEDIIMPLSGLRGQKKMLQKGQAVLYEPVTTPRNTKLAWNVSPL